MQAVVRHTGICATQDPAFAFVTLPAVARASSPTRPTARELRRRGRFASLHPLLFRQVPAARSREGRAPPPESPSGRPPRGGRGVSRVHSQEALQEPRS